MCGVEGKYCGNGRYGNGGEMGEEGDGYLEFTFRESWRREVNDRGRFAEHLEGIKAGQEG